MADFHFDNPLWLLGLVPLALLLWLLATRSASGASGWRRIIDARLQPLLLQGEDGGASRNWLALLGIGWLLTVLALANPVWERQPTRSPR